jgi:hypothetical protein
MDLTVGILLTIVGVGMIGFWFVHILSGRMPDGIRTLESGGYIAFHISIEVITGMLCLTGGLALAICQTWANPIALFASGMLAYTGVNSLAWKEVRNRPLLSLMFIVPTVIAIISAVYLIVSC